MTFTSEQGLLSRDSYQRGSHSDFIFHSYRWGTRVTFYLKIFLTEKGMITLINKSCNLLYFM